MRLQGWIVAVVVAAALAGCGQTSSGILASLAGVHDLTAVGRLVFVTSTDGDELRVIDSQSDVRTGRSGPGFVRAPNPVAILSIPVLEHPVALTPDVHYDANGAELRGPYLYVEGVSGREISVVGATPELLTEMVRLTGTGTITALAGVGPQAEGGESLLFHAEWQEGRSRLVRTALAAPGALTGVPASSDVVDVLLAQALAFPAETVSAMVALPHAADGGIRIAIGLRAVDAPTGRSLLLTLDPTGTALAAAPVVLDFGGPVRMLKTNPRYARITGSGTTTTEVTVLPAGARIFAALDETACLQGSSNCSGIVAVDGLTLDRDTLPDLTLGQRSLDSRGLPMATIETAGDLLVDFDLRPNLVTLPKVGGDRVTLDLGGIISTGSGQFIVFNASSVESINVSSDLPSLVLDGLAFFDASGTALGVPVQVTGSALVTPGTLKLNHGVVREETITVTYQPELFGLNALLLDATGAGDALPTADGVRFAQPDLVTRVRVGDEVVLGGEGCDQHTTVTALDAAIGTLTLAAPPQAGCATVTVSAGATQPWVVLGLRSGWLGRTASGEVFTSVEGQAFAHPPAYVPGAPQLAFSFVVPDSLPLAKGTFLAFATNDGYAAHRSRVTSGLNGPTLTPPGALVLLPASEDFTTGSVWVTYPTQNMVAAFPPDSLVPESPIINAQVYR